MRAGAGGRRVVPSTWRRGARSPLRVERGERAQRPVPSAAALYQYLAAPLVSSGALGDVTVVEEDRGAELASVAARRRVVDQAAAEAASGWSRQALPRRT